MEQTHRRRKDRQSFGSTVRAYGAGDASAPKAAPEARYERNLGALTPEECALLREKTVFVAGCGGLGGYLLELLARLGVGRLRFADGDRFEPSNLNRQLLCQEDLLGQNKALCAKARLAKINSGLDTEAFDAYLTEENAFSLLKGCHIALDALDSIRARRILAAACQERGIPLVHGAIGGWRAQVTVIPPGGKAFEILYPGDAEASTPESLSFTPALTASIQAAEAVKLLTGRDSTLNNRLLVLDLAVQSYEIIDL